MIFIGIGANLATEAHGAPRAGCEAALAELAGHGVAVMGRSHWYRSAPLPPGPQPWFVNGVARLETALDPAGLLALMHRIEADFGRRRGTGTPGGPRVLDLDLLDYDGRVCDGTDEGPVLPHPRLAGRAFVLLPLAELAPDWRHPVGGQSLDELIAALPAGQIARPIE